MNVNSLKNFEIIYLSNEGGDIDLLYQKEAAAMRAVGLLTRIEPSPSATHLLRRGLILDEDDCPKDSRYLQSARTYADYCRIDRWYPLIEPLTIPTVFCDHLGDSAIELIRARRWSRCFIKSSVKSLVENDPLESVWPNISLETLRDKFSQNSQTGPYALREYYPPERFIEEKRYWVIGGQVHHSSGSIPEIVFAAKDRLDALGGVFYTIDATPSFIVEVNSGESADPKTDNRMEDFADWIRQAFT
jgi:hypothetical protein